MFLYSEHNSFIWVQYFLDTHTSDRLNLASKMFRSIKFLGKWATFILASLVPLHYNIYKNRVN